ncbi:MAG: homocitrate synthase [Bacteroidetes bacterium]|jgi:homocitrate synthase NifV|nr:homocitrate synthase [Bacteroidota bacterium]
MNTFSIQPPRLIDSTLRDGEQSPGVAFTKKEKIALARMLDSVGVDEIEVGTPAMGEDVCETIRNIVKLRLNSRICVWSRALEEDIDKGALTGAEAIHIAFPVSFRQLEAMGKDWAWVEQRLSHIVNYARKYFQYVSVGAQDASRCDLEQLFRFIDMADNLNVSRIRLADTVGLFTPLSLMGLFEQIRRIYPNLPIDFHGHNDLGMATANALTAWQCGATDLSVTVNGLGERAGNAALEEVVMALSQVVKVNKYETTGLFSLCNYVASISRRPIHDSKPITGNLVFSHESGVHARCTIKDPVSFQAFDGKLVGRESSSNVFGKHSGKASVKNFLQERNLKISESQLNVLLTQIKAIAQENKRCVVPSEIVKAYQSVVCAGF